MTATARAPMISSGAVVLVHAAVDKRGDYANEQRLITYIALIETALRGMPGGGDALDNAEGLVRKPLSVNGMLRWDAARGVGFLPVEAAPGQVYDADYFAKYVGYADTDMGRAITAARVALVRRHAGEVLLCDVGVGCGSFVEAWPQAVGFDVNAGGVRWLLDRGLYADPYAEPFEALTFWDALEHIAEPAPLLANAREWVFVSAPIVPSSGPPSADWKHYRPTEHCWYWTHQGFIDWMATYGFALVESCNMETALGREDIGTFAFRRKP